MIESFAQPEVSLAIEETIDSCCRESQPAIALVDTDRSILKLSQQMDMVRHDDGTIQEIPVTIKVSKSIQNLNR